MSTRRGPRGLGWAATDTRCRGARVSQLAGLPDPDGEVGLGVSDQARPAVTEKSRPVTQTVCVDTSVSGASWRGPAGLGHTRGHVGRLEAGRGAVPGG